MELTWSEQLAEDLSVEPVVIVGSEPLHHQESKNILAQLIEASYPELTEREPK